MKSLCLAFVLLVVSYSASNLKAKEQIKLQKVEGQELQEINKASFMQSQAQTEEDYENDEDEGDDEKDEYDIIDQHQSKNSQLYDQDGDNQTDLFTSKDIDQTEVEDEEKKDYYASQYLEARLKENEGEANIRKEEETLLRLVTKALLLLLDMNITSNDAVEEVEHYIDIHWNEDYGDAGEDCARYGGEKGGSIYYVYISLDIDEFHILTEKNRIILNWFKDGMDIFYSDLANEEEDEDEIENQNLIQAQDDSGMLYADAYDHYEDNAAEKLNDLLVEGFQLIQETDPNCNDVFYAADDLIEEIWEDDYEDVAESLFTEDRGRTNWIFMQMVKLDLDEISFVTPVIQSMLNRLFTELQSLYKEVEAEKYDNFDQDDDFYLIQMRSTKEVAEKLAYKVLEALDKIDVADSTSNIDCYEIDEYIDEYYDDDYEEAAEAIINYSYKKAADIYVSLSNIDIDECSFLTIDSMDVMNDLYDEMQEVYDDFCDAYAE